MILQKFLFLWICFLCTFQDLCAVSLAQVFEQSGYVELCNNKHKAAMFDALYLYFDALIELFQAQPVLAKKLYIAKESFIRSKERNYYSTDVFGFYDESEKPGRSQISFYYSTHFHQYLSSCYKECHQYPQIINFLQACSEIETLYTQVFEQAADQLGASSVFDACDGRPPILFKVIKYLPDYVATRPHYDGTVFSLFLDSTNNQSLLLSPYQASYTVKDFIAPLPASSAWCQRNSMLLIPGTLLQDFAINPTPHIVASTGTIRYASIAFAMRPFYTAQNNDFTPLPNFYY